MQRKWAGDSPADGAKQTQYRGFWPKNEGRRWTKEPIPSDEGETT
jgi:hypothetical protein